VIDVEPYLRDELAKLPVAPPSDGGWNDVLARAGERGRRRRRRVASAVALAAAAALALAVTPLGGAIAQTLGDFSDWLQGTPGEPATAEEQRAFEQANARSWAGFPGSPELRRLAEVDVDGVHYRLFGFRGGDSLCLRLVASDEATGRAQACAPVSDLRNDEAPARVLLTDYPIGKGDKERTIGFDTYRAPRAQVTAGIVADGVAAVELVDPSGSHRAAVTANSFLYVAERPEVGQRVAAVHAQLDDGTSVAVPFSPPPFGAVGRGSGLSTGEPGGPRAVDYRPEGGRIGWLDRQEARGQPLDVVPARVLGHADVEFGRVLTPDPASPKRMAVMIGKPWMPPRVSARQSGKSVCYFLVSGEGAAGGCVELDKPFAQAPFTFGYSVLHGSDQYATFSGIASDDVASMALYTATGNRLEVPLRDNAFLVEVALARLPAKLVGYDRDGKVIGIRATPPEQGPATVVGQPIVDRRLEIEGGSVELKAYATAEGGECFFVRARGAARVNMGGCVPKEWKLAPVRVSPVGQPPAAFVGKVRADVDHLVVRYEDGFELRLEPDKRGYVLQETPANRRRGNVELVEIGGVAADGKVISSDRLGRR
jgi:hypothetical protein